MDLDSLKAYLDGLSPLVLTLSDTNLGPGLDALVATMPGGRLALSAGPAGITVKGSTLTVDAITTDVWPVQGMHALQVNLATAVITVDASGNASAALTGTMPLPSGPSAPVELAPVPNQPGGWALHLSAAPSAVKVTDLVEIGLGVSLPIPVPSQLDLIDQVAKVDTGAFAVLFAPNTTNDAYYAFGALVPGASWHLLPGVIDFAGVSFNGVITTTGWSLAVVGHLNVGSVATDVGVQLSAGNTLGAFVHPTPPATTFPGVTDLAARVAGGGDLGPQTAAGFANLGFQPSAFDHSLSSVSLAFSLSPPQFVSMEVVGRLTVLGLGLDLVLTLPELTFAGSLADGEPVEVIDMLSAAGLSTGGVPETLTITACDFAADAGAGHYSAGVTLDGVWSAGPLSLDEVTATVTYDKGIGFAGSFIASLAIGPADLVLGAAYDTTTGWTFEGATAPGSSIAIGDVLTELANSFGITDVPGPIRTLSLTGLDVTYQTGTGDFTFACEADFDVDGRPVAVVVNISVKRASGDGAGDGATGYSAVFGGHVTFANLQFDLVFDTESTGVDVLVADCVHTGDAAATSLQALVADVSASLAAAIPAGMTIDLHQVVFAFVKQATSSWAFGLRLGATINLSELPIVGSRLPADDTLAIDNLQVVYASAVMDATQTGLVNSLLPPDVKPLPGALGKGITFEADLVLGGTTRHIEAGLTPPAPSQPSPPSPPALAAAASGAGLPVPASSTDPVKWFDVNRQFGVFAFQRVGLRYQDNVLTFALDASVAVGPLSLSMQALSVGSPLTTFDPVFSLAGLALEFNRPPVTVTGAFLKVAEMVDGKPVTSYYGELMAQVGTFGLKALGGWTPDTGTFFIYVSVDVPLGGPPALFVTGLAGGFGINDTLKLPAVNQVTTFPLLPGLAPPQQGSAAETIAAVIKALQTTFVPKPGEYWVAAGLQFTSFEMIQAQVAVSVSFGVDVQVGVVGVCAMTFPTGAGAEAIAYVEIAVVASFTPSTGLISVDGQLTPASFLLGGFVKLTGGFAFRAWFSGANEGDFVVTLGGYHPAFVKPAQYPDVPRLGLSFSLGALKVSGQSYFALTPHAFMAGLRLDATFSAGPVKAWFSAGFDFVISWAPFHYEADAFVNFGCSVDLGLFTLSVHVGADLQVWGPAFGGTAHIDLSVVSFTIAFGAARSAPPPIGWATFASSFLPAPTPTPTPTPAHGPPPAARAALGHVGMAADPPPPVVVNTISARVEVGQRSAGTLGLDWVVNPDDFRIATASTIPANHGHWLSSGLSPVDLPDDVSGYHQGLDDQSPVPPPTGLAGMYLWLAVGTATSSATQVWATDLSIAPMGQTGVASYHVVSLSRLSESGGALTPVAGVAVTPRLAPSNTALWGPPAAKPEVNGARLIPATLVGFSLSPVPRHPDEVSGVPLLELLYEQDNETGYAMQSPSGDTTYTVSSSISADGSQLTIDVSGAHTAELVDSGYRLSSLSDTWVSSRRAELLDQLRGLGFSTHASNAVDVSAMAATALTDWPAVARVGAAA